ncbi:response regulator [Gorillibacterium timonense]|uniref:response regulator n=1 Tax=Gorillibacterium timonense TaxID=1689269 RepID=UPI00071E299E|nr:response regulator [Gorillibacterium timonense]
MHNLTVLLVDDEFVDLEWLRRRVTGNPQLTDANVVTASSGFAALKIMEEKQIDLLFSDIRMPIMSGMEFARKAKEINPRIHLVFISGHQDFAYAKEAIQMNADGYLLKPVDDGELNAKIAELIARIAHERAQDKALSDTLSLVNQELIFRWLNEETPAQAEAHVHGFLEPMLNGGLTVALIEIDDLTWRMKELPEDEQRSLKASMAEFIRSFSATYHLGTVIKGYDFHFVLLVAEHKERISIPLQELIGEFGKRFPYTITIGTGMPTIELSKLRDSYRQAQAALSIKWIVGKNRLIEDATEWIPKERIAPNLEDKVDQMLKAMLEYDLVAIDDCLHELFGGDNPLTRKNDIYDLIIRITSKLHADLLQMNEHLYDILNWDARQSSVLFQFETVQDVVSWLRRRFFELSELLYLKKQRQKRKLIDNITHFVEERLDTKITLNEVAAHFSFTPNYLGQLFKLETGILFSDYLNELRMKRACELLADPSLKIYEIAEQVGYKNIIYFNRQFKQTLSMTPGEYRKKQRI